MVNDFPGWDVDGGADDPVLLPAADLRHDRPGADELLVADEPMIPEVQVPVPLEVQSVPAKRTRHLLTRAFKRKKITELIE